MTMLLKYCMVSSLQANYILGGDGRPHVLCVWNDQKKKKTEKSTVLSMVCKYDITCLILTYSCYVEGLWLFGFSF